MDWLFETKVSLFWILLFYIVQVVIGWLIRLNRRRHYKKN
jgi:hypothetical protein